MTAMTLRHLRRVAFGRRPTDLSSRQWQRLPIHTSECFVWRSFPLMYVHLLL